MIYSKIPRFDGKKTPTAVAFGQALARPLVSALPAPSGHFYRRCIRLPASLLHSSSGVWASAVQQIQTPEHKLMIPFAIRLETRRVDIGNERNSQWSNGSPV
jgi:hypothetical protein